MDDIAKTYTGKRVKFLNPNQDEPKEFTGEVLSIYRTRTGSVFLDVLSDPPRVYTFRLRTHEVELI